MERAGIALRGYAVIWNLNLILDRLQGTSLVGKVSDTCMRALALKSFCVATIKVHLYPIIPNNGSLWCNVAKIITQSSINIKNEFKIIRKYDLFYKPAAVQCASKATLAFDVFLKRNL